MRVFKINEKDMHAARSTPVSKLSLNFLFYFYFNDPELTPLAQARQVLNERTAN